MNIEEIRLSFSSLKAFGASPAHFAHYKKRTFKTSAAMRRGKLTHTLTLEPHLRDTLKVIDCTTRAAKAYKEAAAIHGEEDVYTRTEVEAAQNLADRVHAHPLAHKLITRAVEVEKHLYWQLEGVDFHGYADVIGRDYIADLKVTDNEPRKLQRWVLDNLYHMQLALYSYAEFNMHSVVKHYLITIDPNAPHGVVVYQLSADFIEDGIRRAKLEVRMFKEWYKDWDGESTPLSYDMFEEGEAVQLDLPSWYR